MGGRVVGAMAALIALVVLWFTALGLFTSFAGLAIAGLIAAIVGIGVGSLVDARRH